MDIVAVPGRQVRDPVTRRVVDDTPMAIDPADLFWVRLLADGDIVEASEANGTSAPARSGRSQEDAS